jgi:DNA-binding Lrp family transcriptional regulator
LDFELFTSNNARGNCQEKFAHTGNLILFLKQDKHYQMEKLTDKQNKVARLIQKDMAVVKYPFDETGESCGLSGKEVLNITKELLDENIIRRFGALLRHQKAGYTKNALVVWSIPPGQVEQSGKILSSYGFVSHCYERNPAFNEKYNLFTMLHFRDENILPLIRDMVVATGIDDYLILESIKEYKKKSPEYFS